MNNIFKADICQYFIQRTLFYDKYNVTFVIAPIGGVDFKFDIVFMY